jgi:hypothetical protein
VEDDHVAGSGLAEVVRDLVDQHAVAVAAVAAVQRLLHRLRRDHVDPRQERLDQEGEPEGHDHQDRQLFPERALALALLGLPRTLPPGLDGLLIAGAIGVFIG